VWVRAGPVWARPVWVRAAGPVWVRAAGPVGAARSSRRFREPLVLTLPGRVARAGDVLAVPLHGGKCAPAGRRWDGGSCIPAPISLTNVQGSAPASARSTTASTRTASGLARAGRLGELHGRRRHQWVGGQSVCQWVGGQSVCQWWGQAVGCRWARPSAAGGRRAPVSVGAARRCRCTPPAGVERQLGTDCACAAKRWTTSAYSLTMSPSTWRAGLTRSIRPTTWPTK